MAPVAAVEARPSVRQQPGAARNVNVSWAGPRLPVVRRRARRETLAGPTCAAAVDVGGAWAAAAGAAPAGHDSSVEDTAVARRPKNQAAPLIRLGALVSAAADALVPLLHGLASAIVTAALRSQAAPLAAQPAAHAMAAGSIAGAGRQLQAGTGRMAARGAAAPAQPAVRHQVEQQAVQHKPQLDLLSILLAPAAPLLAPRSGSAHKAAATDSAESRLSSGSPGGANHAVSSAVVAGTSHGTAHSSEGGAGQLEDLLMRLQAAAAAPHVRSDARFDAVRSLLAAAPASGDPRRNFALSLLDGMAAAEEGDTGIFGQAALLLELSLEEGQPQLQQDPQPPASGGDQLEQMLATLAAAAAAPDVQADPRFAPALALLSVAPPAGEPRRNFARSLLDGVAAAGDDDSSVFGSARALLERALEREEAGPTTSAASAAPAADQYEQLLQALSAAAANAQEPRFAPVQALLAAAPADAPARRNFARSLLDGISAADEQAEPGSVFGLAGLLLERALEDGSLAPAALAPAAAAPVLIRSAVGTPAASAEHQFAKPARHAAAVSKYDGLRQMLRQATVEQDWGIAKLDPFPALAGWAAAPTLTRWQQYALAGEYDRYDPVAQLLQAAKAASSRPALRSKYCPMSALLCLLRGEEQDGAAAAAPAAPPPAVAAVALSGEGEPADQCSRLLAALGRAAGRPGMQLTAQYDGIRALLAAAPPPGEARANFVRSLLDGIAAADSGDGTSVFAQARVLLEMALEEEPGLLRAGDKYDRLLDALATEAEDDPRFEPVRALLGAAPPARDARRNFALSLLDGIAAAQEQDDASSVFGLAGLLLDSALDADPSLLEDDAPAMPAVPAVAAAHAGMAPSLTHSAQEAAAQPVAAPVATARTGKLEPTGLRSKYDPMTALLSWAAAPAPEPAPSAHHQHARYDPMRDLLSWVLEGWAANSERGEVRDRSAAYSG